MQSSLALVDLANMMLGVELKAKLGDEVDLGFKEVDMMFLVVHQLLKEAARHIVLHTVAVGCRFLIKRPRFRFGPQIAVKHLLHRLTDTKGFEGLHVGIAIEEYDALDELVGMLHFLDG